MTLEQLTTVRHPGDEGCTSAFRLKAKYTQDQARQFAELICTVAHERMPDITSIERKPAKRQRRVYLDFLQNRESQTIADPYCIRPRPHAPVSTPLEWKEVKKGLDPKAFTIRSIFKRLEKMGDVWKPVLGKGINLQTCLKKLEGPKRHKGLGKRTKSTNNTPLSP